MLRIYIFITFLLALSLTYADVQFISNVNDYSLNCSIQSSAGNMIGLISTPLSTGNGFKIARIDTSTEPATIFLLNEAIYDNIFIGTFAVDPVLKKVMVMTEIDNIKRLLVYSTLNGTLLNNVIPNRAISAFAIDLHTSALYALSLINDSLWIGSINPTDGIFTPLNDTTATNLVETSQLIDFVSSDYIFISSVGVVLNIHRINLISLIVNVIELPLSLLGLHPISSYNNSLYAFLPVDTRWKFGTINLNTLETKYLESAYFFDGFLRLPMAFDFTTMKLYAPLNDTANVMTFNLNNGAPINSSRLPAGYDVRDCTFEQECICCLQDVSLSQNFKLLKDFKLSSTNKFSLSNVIESCSVITNTSSAHKKEISILSIIISLLSVTVINLTV